MPHMHTNFYSVVLWTQSSIPSAAKTMANLNSGFDVLYPNADPHALGGTFDIFHQLMYVRGHAAGRLLQKSCHEQLGVYVGLVVYQRSGSWPQSSCSQTVAQRDSIELWLYFSLSCSFTAEHWTWRQRSTNNLFASHAVRQISSNTSIPIQWRGTTV